MAYGSFLSASIELVKAAKALRTQHGTNELPLLDYRRTVSLGVAADWLRWATNLHELSFRSNRAQKRNRAEGMKELTRFYYAWTGANALFGNSEILKTLDPSFGPDDRKGELDRLEVLVEGASLDMRTTDNYTAVLMRFLLLDVAVTRFPWDPSVQRTPLLNVIYEKYSDPSQHERKTYKKIKRVLEDVGAVRVGLEHYRKVRERPTGSSLAESIKFGYSGSNRLGSPNTHELWKDLKNSMLHLPLIIYMTRNWLIHGALLNSGFRGSTQKFVSYLNVVNTALAEILHGAARTLRLRLS